mmetsp:Transcript_70787/g.162285  ORF Transcript_70787/g.162285 Transcript_70787/m.162285 type:complete len:498 (+) Transcript_70787:52-1545(+)
MLDLSEFSCTCGHAGGHPPRRGAPRVGPGGLGPRAGLAAGAVSAAKAADVLQEKHDGPRNIVAEGMSRFQTDVDTSQPPWEVLSDRVTCVLAANPNTYTLNGTNCYLVGTGTERLLIDTGERYIGAAERDQRLKEAMAHLGVTGLSGIVITHMHHDHFGGVDAIQKLFGPVPVYASRLSAESRESTQLWKKFSDLGYIGKFFKEDGEPIYHPKRDKMPKRTEPPFCHMDGMDFSFLGRGPSLGAKTEGDMPTEYQIGIAALMAFVWEGRRFRQQIVTGEYEWREFQSGGVIEVEGAKLICTHGPGHSSDHYTFRLVEEESTFSGDHVLGFGTTFVNDMYDYMATLRQLLASQPRRLYPGHGPMIPDGVSLLSRYEKHRQARIDQVWEAVSGLEGPQKPFEVDQLARQLYTATPESRMGQARENVERILRQFEREGKIALMRYAGADDRGEEGDGQQVVAGTGQFVRMKAPSTYEVRQLPPGVYFSVVEEEDIQRSKL